MWVFAAMSPRSIRLASDYLLLRRQQRHAADRPQIQPQRIEARLDRQVELGFARRRRGAGLRRLLPGLGDRLDLSVLCDDRTAVCTDHVDAVLVEVGMEVSHLFLGDLHLLEARGDLGKRQEALLLTLANEPSELLHLHDGGALGQQNVDRQPSILRSRRFRSARSPGSPTLFSPTISQALPTATRCPSRLAGPWFPSTVRGGLQHKCGVIPQNRPYQSPVGRE